MNEINFSASNPTPRMDKTLSSAGQQKNISENKETVGDSVELSRLPDLSKVEAAVEDEFASLRAKFEEQAESAAYPPLETIDRLARMLATGGPEL
jgi:hypothetical protein